MIPLLPLAQLASMLPADAARVAARIDRALRSVRRWPAPLPLPPARELVLLRVGAAASAGRAER